MIFALILAWLFGLGICSVLVYFCYQAYELADHWDCLEENAEREGHKSLKKLVELEVLRWQIDKTKDLTSR